MAALLGAGLCTAPAHAAPAADAGAEAWTFDATIYLWAAGIQGDTTGGGHVDVGFDTLVSNLDMAFMGSLEARKARWSLLTDVVYMDVGANDSAHVNVPVVPGIDLPVRVDADVRTKGTVLGILGGYNLLQTETATIDLRAGVRHLSLQMDLDLQLQPDPVALLAIQRELHTAVNVWDGIVGLGGEVQLGQRWHALFYADLGTGESHLTWQAQLGVGYDFDWGDVALSYRHLEWDLKSDSEIDNIRFSGPLLSASYRF